ncbi:hypothetical protein Taro_040248 [Colocasia esculenta]|uniref:Uncharacterized protein n=1 Tax=Colocasia esculenta TaxID=4460 RepID=A0A843WL99_COLES|nr:hypothetical protein [Colocasia esculenta]
MRNLEDLDKEVLGNLVNCRTLAGEVSPDRLWKIMDLKPTVVLRAVLVSGIAAFAKIAGAMKAAGGVKIGTAAAAMTAAATAAVSGTKRDENVDSRQPTNKS